MMISIMELHGVRRESGVRQHSASAPSFDPLQGDTNILQTTNWVSGRMSNSPGSHASDNDLVLQLGSRPSLTSALCTFRSASLYPKMESARGGRPLGRWN